MSSIDERIVEMRFDNKQFESGVQTSLKSLDSLKKGLNLEDAAKGLQNLEKAGRSFSLANVASGVEAISNKFTTMGIIGVTALQNMTNAAINAGKRIASALTIDPIKTGFAEYETQINAVQTILANTSSKGTTIDQVNAALDELNTYADKTIYNFTEMTRNIGTFTAAGVDLETSTSAIKGIANLAAVSGSNAQQASTAMYQLSQAMAAGTVKLQDWNSVVNAGMGGQVFQDALKDTARVHGVQIDKMIKNEGSFRETLQKGWLTSEILTETLSKFTGDLNEEQLKTMGYTNEQITAILKMGQTANDAATKVKTFTQLWDTLKEAAQSGWSQSWEILIGDFEEAKELLTEVSNVLGEMIGSSAEARNEMLQGWKDLGGRATLIEAVKNAFEGVLSVITPIKEAFSEIFPPMTAEQLNNITIGLRDLTATFKMGEGPAGELKRTFKGLFAIIDIGVQAFSAFLGAIGSVVGYIAPAGAGLLSFTAGIGDWLVTVDEAVKQGNIFSRMFETIGNILKPVADGVKATFGVIAEAIKGFASVDLSGLDGLAERVGARFAPFGALGGVVGGAIQGIINVLKGAAPIFADLGSNIGKALGKVGEAFRTLNFDGLLDLFNSGVFAALILGIKKFMDSLGSITDNAGDFLGSITGILDGVKGSLEAFQSSIKAGTLLKIAGAMAILAASLVALSVIDSEKLAGALAAISVLFVELFGSMMAFEKLVAGPGFSAMGKLSVSMIALSTAILILSNALKNIAELDWDQLVRGLTGVAGLSAILVVSAKALSTSSKTLIKGSLGLITFAAAIRVLVGAVEELGALDVESLTKGLIGVGVLCAELALFFKVTNLDGLSVGKGVGMIALAAAIRILASAVEVFGALDISSLLKGLAGVGVVLAELAIFTKMTGDSKKVISTAIGMTILGSAMLIFGQAIAQMGSMSLEEIGKGLLAMAGSLAAITIALNFMPKNMVGIGVGMVAIGAALLILSNALISMGGMSWEEIAKGLVALGGSMAILAIALNAMVGALPGAAAMLVVSAALAIFTPALLALGSMSLGEIGTALLALAGVFVVLGGAALILGPLTPVLLGLSAAVALLGVGVLAVGAGILAFAAGLSALAVAGTAGAAALVLVVTSLIGLIPMVLEQIGYGLIAIANVIAKGGPAIMEAMVAVLMAIIQAIAIVAPDLVEALLGLVTMLLEKLASYIPKMVQAGVDIILGLLRGIRDNIGEVIATGVEVVIAFVEGIASQIPVVIDAAFDLIIDFIDGLGEAIKENTPRLVEAVIGLGGDIIQGLIDGLFAGIKAVGGAIIEVGSTALSNLADFLGIHSPSREFAKLGEYSTVGFGQGITSKESVVKNASTSLGETVLGSLKSALGITEGTSETTNKTVGQPLVQGIADGIKNNKSAEKAAKEKANTIVTAFKTELDKLSLDITTVDLEYQLWDKMNANTTSSLGRSTAEISMLGEKLKVQSEKVGLAEKEYQVTLKTFGESAEVTQEAYNKYLQAQVEQANLQDQLTKLKNDQMLAQQEFQLDTGAMELEFQLWEQLNGRTASNAEKASMEIDLISKKLSAQAERVGLAQSAYEQAISTYGASSIEAQNAYKAMLESQIELTSMASTLTDLRATATQNQQAAQTRYYDWMIANAEQLQKMGYTMEQIQKAAQEASGFDPNALADKMEPDVEKAVETAMTSVKEAFSNNAKNTFGGLLTNFTGYGTSYATAVGTGVVEGTPKTVGAVQSMVTQSADSIKNEQPKWIEAGAYLVDAFSQGIRDNVEKAAQEAAEMAMAAYKAAMGAIGGEPIRNIGWVDTSKQAVESTANTIKTTTTRAMSAAARELAKNVDDNLDTSPVIIPVVDWSGALSDYQRYLDAVNSKSNLRLSTSMDSASTAAKTTKQAPVGPNKTEEGSTTIQFFQTNNSPKALSRIDIYRQTKNQISSLKGRVK